MSWVMRSPSCSQTFRSCARRRPLGIVDEQVAAAAARSAARCARPPRPAPSAWRRARGAAKLIGAGYASTPISRALPPGPLRIFHVSITTSQPPGRCAAGTLPRSWRRTPRVRRSCMRASSRSVRAKVSCSRRAGADAVGARVRTARRDGAAPGGDHHPRGALPQRLGRRTAGGRPLGRCVREQAARQARAGAAGPPLHPHAPRASATASSPSLRGRPPRRPRTGRREHRGDSAPVPEGFHKMFTSSCPTVNRLTTPLRSRPTAPGFAGRNPAIQPEEKQ